ncbi:MAG: hypothetical protein HC834_04005 [Rhodospirillales bacterium]|nr:hypothetical protein [Rhodospirillales bacterium]
MVKLWVAGWQLAQTRPFPPKGFLGEQSEAFENQAIVVCCQWLRLFHHIGNSAIDGSLIGESRTNQNKIKQK